MFSNLKAGAPFPGFPGQGDGVFYQFSFLLCLVVLRLGLHPQDEAIREKRKKTKNRRLTPLPVICASFGSLVYYNVVAFHVFFRVFSLIIRKNKL